MNFKLGSLKLVILIIFFSNICQFKANDNLISKAFYHLGTLQDKIIFYLPKKPKLMLLCKTEKPQAEFENQEIWLLENVKISKEAKTAVNKINNFKHPFYKFKVAQAKEGIKIIIDYNPNFIEKIDPLFFDAISLYKGIMFYVLHKDATKHFNITSTVVKNKKPIVVIDCGHGGLDSGGVGLRNVAEKDIVLAVGLKLKKLLNDKKINVFLTRETDVFVPLDDRTKLANFLPSNSIFISIHANQSVNPNACGLETYYADYSLLKNHKDESSFMDTIGFDISKKNKSLACIIHESIYNEAKKIDPTFKDRKVRKSVSQILIGTQMPSILLELGYLSNEQDNKLLQNKDFQLNLANGILKGIEKYL